MNALNEGGTVATIIIAVTGICGIVGWLIRRIIGEEMAKMHEGQRKVLRQVQNSHDTNLRDDIDKALRGIATLDGNVSKLRDDMLAHLSWHDIEQHRPGQQRQHRGRRDGL